MTRSHRRSAATITGALALCITLGLVGGLGAPRAAAEQEQAKGKGPVKGKVGDRCEKTSDCQRSPEALVCAPAGDHKECALPPSRPPVPPAT